MAGYNWMFLSVYLYSSLFITNVNESNKDLVLLLLFLLLLLSFIHVKNLTSNITKREYFSID